MMMGNQFHWVLQLHNSRRLWIFNPFGYCGLYRRHTRRDEEDKLHDSKRVGTEINNSTDARAVMFKIKQKIWYQISKSNPKWFILFVFFVFFIINNNVTQFPASTSLGGGELFVRSNRWDPLERAGSSLFYMIIYRSKRFSHVEALASLRCRPPTHHHPLNISPAVFYFYKALKQV